ncbi:FAD-dependent oxidoreductase [Acidianus brierleyi]|uniref:Pyridine nucleotide-disulfide oxidoreductase n=1 Tax=Acidianus brierleyi TaxID=41673 RepID=A0A2U9IFB5_9CREN|nr:NAD(P)/FAD-dependent oxidoreductase [Acidianus brierleyi]AWR94733.1 NAD(P)-binding protein [Acidianus brierleyi]
MNITVVGSGPAGLYAAISAARTAKVKLVEKQDRLGGTCVLYGCIPSKAMLHPSILAYELSRLGRKIDFSFDEAQKFAKEAIDRLSKGAEYMLESQGVEVIHGTATYRSGKINVGNESIESDGIVIATGTEKPKVNFTIASDDIPYLNKDFNSVAVIGGGVGGVEYSWLIKMLGKDVHIFEKQNEILPYLDSDLRREVTKYFKKIGIKLHLGHDVTISENKVRFADEEFSADLILFTFGRKPLLDGFEEIPHEKWIRVDERMYTGVGNIYAAGDITGSFTAHEAINKGVVAGLNVIGNKKVYSPIGVPKVLYIEPQIAYVGNTNGKCVKINMAEVARAIAEKETEGFVKICFENNKIVGAVAFSERAEEIISLISVLMRSTLEEAREFIAPHPSYLEAVWEALRRFEP